MAKVQANGVPVEKLSKPEFEQLKKMQRSSRVSGEAVIVQGVQQSSRTQKKTK